MLKNNTVNYKYYWQSDQTFVEGKDKVNKIINILIERKKDTIYTLLENSKELEKEPIIK
jgi:hypothetical protein